MSERVEDVILFIHYLSLTSPLLSLRDSRHPGPYRATTGRERELTLDHIQTFLTTQGDGGPPRRSDQKVIIIIIIIIEQLVWYTG